MKNKTLIMTIALTWTSQTMILFTFCTNKNKSHKQLFTYRVNGLKTSIKFNSKFTQYKKMHKDIITLPMKVFHGMMKGEEPFVFENFDSHNFFL